MAIRQCWTVISCSFTHLCDSRTRLRKFSHAIPFTCEETRKCGHVYYTCCTRFCSRIPTSGALMMKESAEAVLSGDEKDDLKSRIFRLRFRKLSATDLLQRWVQEGNQISKDELLDISKELRKSQRYKHALEMSEWMVTHQEFQLSDSDRADRIDLINKVFGIHAAERYFEGLPLSSKTCETYTALLHSYAGAELIEQAEDLYEKIKASSLPFAAVTYNEMMTLYMSIGQVEKISLVMEELKLKKVAPDLFTYNLWASSYAASLDIEGVKRILEQMCRDSGVNADWIRYTNLVNIYVNMSSASPNSLVDADEMNSKHRNWIAYDMLILLYAGLRNKTKISQIWDFVKKSKQKVTGGNYVGVISSYVMLSHMKEAGEVIDQWKLSFSPDFHVPFFGALLNSFSQLGLKGEVESLRSLLIEKNCWDK